MKLRVFLLLVGLLLVVATGSVGCIDNEPESPPATPEYHTLSFALEGEGTHSFPIYLHNNETLHFMMTTEGGRCRAYVSILTPSGESICSYGAVPDNPGEYAGGTLSSYACQSFIYFITQFSPSDYGWGEGYYRIEFRNESRDPGIAKVEYWTRIKE